MKFFLFMIASNLVPVTALLCAAYLAVNNISGWGWFIFIAMITVVVGYGNKKSD